MNQYHASAHPELYTLSNVGPDGKPNGRHPDRGTMAWHTDGSWQSRATKATMLYAEIVPSRGGGTGFADMYAAFEAMPADEQRRLAAMRAVHNLDFSRNRRHGEEPMTDAQRKAVPPVEQPVVRVHPETGRKAIYLGDHAERIVGMDYEEGRALIDRLNDRIIDIGRTYFHDWRPRDLMVWDNRCLLHKAGTYDLATEPRVIQRAVPWASWLSEASSLAITRWRSSRSRFWLSLILVSTRESGMRNTVMPRVWAAALPEGSRSRLQASAPVPSYSRARAASTSSASWVSSRICGRP
jgi:alpha-ketoglutarate-dependent taurine dioxygenase